MGRRNRPKLVANRCLVCSKITTRFFSITEYPDDPKFPLCHRHHSEIEKIGWFLACEKYDFLAIYLSAWGFFFGDDQKPYFQQDNKLI